jgi:hypothetical protein
MSHEDQSPANASIEHRILAGDEMDFPAPGENMEFPNGGNSDPIGSGGGGGGGGGQPPGVDAASSAVRSHALSPVGAGTPSRATAPGTNARS